VASMVQRFQIIWPSTPTSSPCCGNSACIENGQHIFSKWRARLMKPVWRAEERGAAKLGG
jgi:hypothetical protein